MRECLCHTNVHFFVAAEEFQAYVSSLPATALPLLEWQLDEGNWGVEKDLIEIAHCMLEWEVMLAPHLGLTAVDMHDITKGISDLALQR